MKKGFLYVLIFWASLGCIFPKNAFAEALKLPMVGLHYIEHLQGESSSLSFLDFILMHYSLGSTHDEPQHENLPLCSDVAAGSFYYTPIQIFTLTETVVLKTKKCWGIYSDNYFFLAASRLILPPR